MEQTDTPTPQTGALVFLTRIIQRLDRIAVALEDLATTPQPAETAETTPEVVEDAPGHGISINAKVPRLRPEVAMAIADFTMARVRRDEASRQDLRDAYRVLEDPESAVRHVGMIRFAYDLTLKTHSLGKLPAAQAEEYRAAWNDLAPYPIQSLASLTSRLTRPSGDGQRGPAFDPERLRMSAKVAAAIIADADRKDLLGEMLKAAEEVAA